MSLLSTMLENYEDILIQYKEAVKNKEDETVIDGLILQLNTQKAIVLAELQNHPTVSLLMRLQKNGII